MDKTHNIGLGGFSFTIEEMAYNKLRNYLQAIRQQLGINDSTEEIITDIEYRMAELLKERLKSREIVNTSDVNHLISVLGKPEEYGNETEEQPTQTSHRKIQKKLFRDPDNQKIAGVCSGLAHYMEIDPTWIRLIFIILPISDFLFLGFSTTSLILLYIVLWAVIPEAVTTSDKLQMRGESINVSTISDFSQKKTSKSSGGEPIIVNIIKFIAKGFALFFAFIFGTVTVALLFAFLATILFGGTFFLNSSLIETIPLVFEHKWEQVLVLISTCLVFVIPFLALTLISLRIISKRLSVSKAVTMSLVLAFIIGLIGISIGAYTRLTNFKNKEIVVKKQELPIIGDTLFIHQNHKYKNEYIEDKFNLISGQLILDTDNYLEVESTQDSIPYLEMKLSSRGKTVEAAMKNLNLIEVQPKLIKNTLNINSFFALSNNRWRQQEVEYTLYLPKDMIFQPTGFYKIKHNGNRLYVKKKLDFLQLKEGAIHCVSCDDDEIEEPSSSNVNIKINGDTMEIENDTIIETDNLNLKIGNGELELNINED